MRHPFFFNGFFFHNIKKGFGLRSFKLFLHVCFLLKKFIHFSPISFFFGILEEIRPHVSFRITRFKPRLSYSPYGLTTRNSYNLGFKWVIQSSRERLGFSKRIQLFLEIVACFLKQSKVNSLRIETHLLAHKYMRNLWRRRRSKTVRIIRLDLDNIYTLQISKRVLGMLLFLLRTVLTKPGQSHKLRKKMNERQKASMSFPVRKKKKFDRRRIVLIGPPVFRRQGELIMDKLEGKPVKQPILMRTKVFFEALASKHLRLRESTNYDFRPKPFRDQYSKKDLFYYRRQPYGPNALKQGDALKKKDDVLIKSKRKNKRFAVVSNFSKKKTRRGRKVRVPRASDEVPYYLWESMRAVPISFKKKALVYLPIRSRVRKGSERPMASMFFSREWFFFMKEWSTKNRHFRRAFLLERWSIRLRRLYLSQRLQKDRNIFPISTIFGKKQPTAFYSDE